VEQRRRHLRAPGVVHTDEEHLRGRVRSPSMLTLALVKAR
jgi:hypothetical protein